jgi:hypothetical protein
MLAQAAAQYLAQAGLLDYRPDQPGGDGFLDELPDRPDEAVALRDTDGLQPTDQLPYDWLGLQIIVRGTRTPGSSAERAWAIYGALEGLAAVELPGGLWLVRCDAQQPPTRLGPDPAGRHRHSVNFLAHCRVPTTHRPAL